MYQKPKDDEPGPIQLIGGAIIIWIFWSLISKYF